jgi:Na+/melibiose symporter-like transporter
MSSPTQPDSAVPLRVLLAYAAPAIASSFVFTAVILYLLKFSTDVLLIAPATVGLIFAIGRFWDAFIAELGSLAGLAKEGAR